MGKANAAKAKAKVQDAAPVSSIKDFLAGLDPSKMSREEILLYAQKAQEMEEILSKTRESERRACLELALEPFTDRMEILGLNSGDIAHIQWAIRELTYGRHLDTPLTPDTFEEKVGMMLFRFPLQRNFQFTWKESKDAHPIWVRVRPQTKKEKKATEAEQTEQTTTEQAEPTKAEKAAKALSAIS